MKTIITQLKKIVGAEWVRTDALSRYYHASDVMTHFGQGNLYPENHPAAVVYPGSARHIQDIVKLARKHDLPLYPVGGGTVLLIGSIPGRPNAGITLDFRRMQKITVDRERNPTRCSPVRTKWRVIRTAWASIASPAWRWCWEAVK